MCFKTWWLWSFIWWCQWYSSPTLSAGGDFTVITGLTSDSYGHITKATTTKFTLPGNITVGNEDKLLSIDNLDIKASTGNIELDNVNVTNDINIKASTGNVRLYDVKSENLDICVSTGNIKLSDVICDNKIEAEASTGNIRLDRTDAYTLDLTTSTGNIKGNLLTGKIFDVHVSTGSSKYPDSDLTKGLCKIHTSTGDVNISIYVPAE